MLIVFVQMIMLLFKNILIRYIRMFVFSLLRAITGIYKLVALNSIAKVCPGVTVSTLPTKILLCIFYF